MLRRRRETPMTQLLFNRLHVPIAVIRTIGMLCAAFFGTQLCMRSAHASPTPAPIVFVHAAPIGAAGAGAKFLVDGTEVASLQVHEHTREIPIRHGNVRFSAVVPGIAAPITTATATVIVGDQPYTALLAGDGIRVPYQMVVQPSRRNVPRRGTTSWISRFETATDSRVPSSQGGRVYRNFTVCGDGYGTSSNGFGGAGGTGFVVNDTTRLSCRSGLFDPETNAVVSQAVFEAGLGRRIQVYFTGNGLEAPLRTNIIVLDDEPELVPRPMGADMVGLWSSRARSGEMLTIQTSPTGLSGIYTGFGDDGRPVWSSFRADESTSGPELYRLVAMAPIDGDPSGQRPPDSLATDAGTLIFVSCNEAIIEFWTGLVVPPPSDVFVSTTTREPFRVVRLSRITAPNGCSDP
jgi:hypothetical protein